MSESLVMPGYRRSADSEHLKLLAIFHFVGAGLAVIPLLIMTVHGAFILGILIHSLRAHLQNPSPYGFAMLLCFWAVFEAWILATFAMNVASGWYLLNRKNRRFSIVVAAMNCVHVPLGTILGVFTIVILLRDSVRELYDLQKT